MSSSPKHPGLRGQTQPALRAAALVRRRPLDAAADPVEVFADLVATNASGGALLLESADLHAPEGRKTLIVPSPLLRVRLIDSHFRLDALDARGAALLDAVENVREGERIAPDRFLFPTDEASTDPAQSDHERIVSPSCLDGLRDLLMLIRDEDGEGVAEGVSIGLYGAFGFELMDRFEALPERRPDPLEEPDLNLVLAIDGIVFDHERGQLVATARDLRSPTGEPIGPEDRHHRLSALMAAVEAVRTPARLNEEEHLPLPEAVPDMTDDEYRDGVATLQDHVGAGDVFQAVLSRGLAVESSADTLDVYRHLRHRNPSPYMFHYDLGDGVLLGASPETCVRCEGGNLMLSPIAGTVPRGFLADGSPDHDRDARLAVSLLLDRKEQSEHAMLMDLARNDVARISVPGTREVERPFTVERFSHVQHLVSRVVGRLKPDLDALDAYRACANMGTLTGAPKLRAVELIRDLENTGRGYYGGALGYITADGDLDTCIIIRSLRYKYGVYHARAGAGVVRDSIPERELQETRVKARAPLLAIAQADAAGERS